ncbi:ABC transporter ATP-binding protein [Sinorhizobium sp. BJ1]|uniref:ABC transporter ATP-binding protein n=1 Tax=Sinorhizobium sp. BJ1 TaxID=2035455 RepID=UPI000BE87DDA|nr:ABC transporter ATP-binding protein [Sinorhizobium sp. BJ1]PDT79748.1 ABC transporter ATP-binding protein [Sinorhizobium sp. BJ1]
MIKVDVRRKAFGDEEILRDIHFEMEVGETLAILGPSGIGKSTLLRLIAGIDHAFKGEINRPEKIAMVFQEPVLLPWRSVLQNLTLVHTELGTQAALSALERVGIVDKAPQFPGQLSLGQQRRLALARAFAGRPELLVMDEPYVSLDPATAEEMLALTEALIAETGPAVILVTHSDVEANRLTRRCLRLAGKPATITGDVAPRSALITSEGAL